MEWLYMYKKESYHIIQNLIGKFNKYSKNVWNTDRVGNGQYFSHIKEVL